MCVWWGVGGVKVVIVAKLSKQIKLDQDSQLVFFRAIHDNRQRRPWRRDMQRPSIVPLLDQGPRAPAGPCGPLRSPGSRGPASRCAPLMSSSLSSAPGPLLPRVGGVHGGGTVGPAGLGQHQAGGAADGTRKGGKKRGESKKKKKKKTPKELLKITLLSPY